MELTKGLLAVALGITLGAAAQERVRAEPRFSSGQTTIAWEVLDKGLSDGNESHRQQAVLAGGVIGPTPDAVKFVARTPSKSCINSRAGRIYR